MRFKLTATHLLYRCNHIDDAPMCLKKYIELSPGEVMLRWIE